MDNKKKALIKAFLTVYFERAVRDISVGMSFVMLPTMIYISYVYNPNYGFLCVVADIVLFLLAYFADRAAEEDEKKVNELYSQWQKERMVRNGKQAF